MRFLIWPSMMVLLLTILAPVVQAQNEDLMSGQVEIDIQSGIQSNLADTVNLMDETTYQLEKDTIFETLEGVEGRYYGPYMESSLFQFSHEGNMFQFVTNFTIGADTIMNGVSEFWLRVPVVPSQYEYWHVWTNWGYGKILETDTPFLRYGWWEEGDDIWWRFPNLFPDLEVMRLWFPWQFESEIPSNQGDYFLSTFGGFHYCPDNFWSPESGDTYDIIQRTSGIYIRLQGIYEPGTSFWVMFTGRLLDYQKPRVYLTGEHYSDDPEQNFRFFNPWRISFSSADYLYECYPDIYGFKYDFQETLSVYPAWAFVFTTGIGREGMTSYILDFYEENDYLLFGQYFTSFTNNSFVSLYMPYSIVDEEELGAQSSGTTMDWNVTVTLNYTVYPGPFFNTTGSFPSYVNEVSFTVYNSSSYLLFSTPYSVFYESGDESEAIVWIKLRPERNCRVMFLGADIEEPFQPGGMISPTFYKFFTYYGDPQPPGSTGSQYPVTNYTRYFHEDQRASWDNDYLVNAHVLPLFKNIHESWGRWAEVEATSYYWIYDFGWGLGYVFPGDTNIYMFLDNGGSYFYDGSYADFADYLESGPPSLWDELWDGLEYIAGKIWDGLMWVWEGLKTVGEWIYNTLVEIVDWIVTCVKDIAGKVAHIVEGMLYGVPILVVLFVVNYAGQMLYAGRLPRLGKERKLYRKIKRGPFRTKTYRRLRHARELTPYLRKKRLRDAPGYARTLPARYRTYQRYRWKEKSAKYDWQGKWVEGQPPRSRRRR